MDMMHSLLYVFFSLTTIGLSYKLFCSAAGDMSLLRPNLVSVTFYCWLVGLIYIGNTLHVIGVENYTNRLVKSEDSYYLAFWATTWVLISMPVAMIFYQKKIFGGQIKAKINIFYGGDLEPLQSKFDSFQIFFWILITIMVFGATLYSYASLSSYPLFSILQGAVSGLGSDRYEAKFNFSGNVYVKNLLMEKLAVLSSYIAYSYSKLYDKKLILKLWFFSTLVLAILAIGFTGEKAPFVVYFLSLFVVKGLIDRGWSKFVFLLLLSICTIMMAGLYLLIDQGIHFSFYGGIVSRMVMVPSAGLVLAFDIFPSQHDFLIGASFPAWMISIFGMEHARSARVIMEIVNPSGVAAGTAGVMNSLFIAEAWANFSWLGLIIAPLLVGFVIQLFHNIIVSQPKSPVFVALFGYFIFNMPVNGGFVDFIWNIGWMFIFLVLYLGIFYRQFFVRKTVFLE